ncbi:MAG: hypothetical protein N4A32_03945 [Marinifilaceae bacterium]|jgi:hypothetical protein|nr:hypothetical protein [Marinifilaceae bacterium]
MKELSKFIEITNPQELIGGAASNLPIKACYAIEMKACLSVEVKICLATEFNCKSIFDNNPNSPVTW